MTSLHELIKPACPDIPPFHKPHLSNDGIEADVIVACAAHFELLSPIQIHVATRDQTAIAAGRAPSTAQLWSGCSCRGNSHNQSQTGVFGCPCGESALTERQYGTAEDVQRYIVCDADLQGGQQSLRLFIVEWSACV